ncbi:MAG TPA: alpha/beta hydrolase [Candidatus Sulfotelmatobacter sp.]|nr:alpha/beta hydrolase [Candidatus Sulfotelmatobacter sp.]
MKDAASKKAPVSDSSLLTHPLAPEDAPVMTAMRAAVLPLKGKLQGIAAREPFNGIMEHVSPPEGVSFHPDAVGGISGVWCKPSNARSGDAILHLHGGWFNWGSAQAYRNLVGHIAARTAAEAFVPDYSLAPEHPFPAAVNDVHACYRGLLARGIPRIAISGDSAGGNLALVLLSLAAASGGPLPVGAAALSPVTDLALTGPSFQTRADADPYFVRPQIAALVRSYLGDTDPNNPLASPLYGDLAGLPPLSIHVGDDEVLLDDSRRYFERAVAAGVNARLDVWEGMPHGFVGSVGTLASAANALDAVGEFLAQRLKVAASV